MTKLLEAGPSLGHVKDWTSFFFLSQGALTHGDRRATESQDLSRYNFDKRWFLLIFCELQDPIMTWDIYLPSWCIILWATGALETAEGDVTKDNFTWHSCWQQIFAMLWSVLVLWSRMKKRGIVTLDKNICWNSYQCASVHEAKARFAFAYSEFPVADFKSHTFSPQSLSSVIRISDHVSFTVI